MRKRERERELYLNVQIDIIVIFVVDDVDSLLYSITMQDEDAQLSLSDSYLNLVHLPQLLFLLLCHIHSQLHCIGNKGLLLGFDIRQHRLSHIHLILKDGHWTTFLGVNVRK